MPGGLAAQGKGRKTGLLFEKKTQKAFGPLGPALRQMRAKRAQVFGSFFKKEQAFLRLSCSETGEMARRRGRSRPGG